MTKEHQLYQADGFDDWKRKEDELEALRAVADAAKRYLDEYAEMTDDEMKTALDVMEMALRAAGR